MKKKIRSFLVSLKNNNLLFFYIWSESLRHRGIRELKKFSDVQAINKLYFSYSGRYPDLENPKLFSEKMQWLKLNYFDAELQIAADKFKVREYLSKKGYSGLLNEILQIYENIDDLKLKDLPKGFVIKASHGSGWNLIVRDKKKINWIVWRLILKSWLKHNIFWNGREWVYKNIKPRLVCEKYLEDESGALMDYKFHCFNGVPKFIQANNGRGQKVHAQNFYDLDWEFLPFGKDLTPIPEVKIPKPFNLQKMYKIATDLATKFPYVRVDFYEVNQKIIFGELTFFPASGMPDFKPVEYDKIWGEMLDLPKKSTTK